MLQSRCFHLLNDTSDDLFGLLGSKLMHTYWSETIKTRAFVSCTRLFSIVCAQLASIYYVCAIILRPLSYYLYWTASKTSTFSNKTCIDPSFLLVICVNLRSFFICLSIYRTF